MSDMEFSPTDYLEFIEEASKKTIALIELADAEIPRIGESVKLNAHAGATGASYEVKAVIHDYARRWKSGGLALRKVTVILAM